MTNHGHQGITKQITVMLIRKYSIKTHLSMAWWRSIFNELNGLGPAFKKKPKNFNFFNDRMILSKIYPVYLVQQVSFFPPASCGSLAKETHFWESNNRYIQDKVLYIGILTDVGGNPMHSFLMPTGLFTRRWLFWQLNKIHIGTFISKVFWHDFIFVKDSIGMSNTFKSYG